MQVLKEEVRESIMQEAQNEFVRNGFQKASMRRIADAAGLSVGNLYNYFRNKDALFNAVLRPMTSTVRDYFSFVGGQDMRVSRIKWSYEYHLEVIPVLARFIDDNRELLELLVFRSYGSSLEPFKDEIIDRFTEVSLGFFEKAKAHVPELKGGMSRFCMHNIASFGFTAITEILMHDIPYEEMLHYMREIMTFMYFGYQATLNCDFDEIASRLH